MHPHHATDCGRESGKRRKQWPRARVYQVKRVVSHKFKIDFVFFSPYQINQKDQIFIAVVFDMSKTQKRPDLYCSCFDMSKHQKEFSTSQLKGYPFYTSRLSGACLAPL